MRAHLACLMTVLLASLAADAAELGAVVRKTSIDVLAEPKLEATKIAAIKRDAAVVITAQDGLWYELRLPDGRRGFVRVNDVRVDYARAEHGADNLRVLTGGKSGEGRVTETAGVRGIDKSDLQSAAMDQAQLDAMVAQRIDDAPAAAYAGERGWQATNVPYDGETKKKKGKQASGSPSGSSTSAAMQEASGMMSSMGQMLGSFMGTAQKAAPRPEEELAAEELALGPEIAGRVLGARPLWGDAAAQERVNLIGRWVASQTSRPDLPWTFGVIDDAEVNAFAAPGGYVLMTRGLYELATSDSELAAVLAHEISHCVQRDHYNVIRQQELATLGKDTVSGQVTAGTGSPAEAFARQYVEKHGAAILLTALDRDAEFRADKASEIYLARSGMNPMALYSVLQKMTALGEKSPSLAQLYRTHPSLHARMDRIDERGYEKLQAYVTRE